MKNIVEVKSVVDEKERADIENVCSGNSDISLVSEFLKKEFAVNITTEADIVEGFISDSSNLPGAAVAVARPSTEKECAILFLSLYCAKIPYTISAGKSNLTGSATPPEGVIISLNGLVVPDVTVDLEKKIVSSGVGIILEDLRNEVLKQSDKKLLFTVDPTSRAEAMLGGALACNASGFVPGEKGSMRMWVKELHILLPDGNKIVAQRGEYISDNGNFVFSHNGQDKIVPVPVYPRINIKNAAGPFSDADGKMDLIDLIIGSEGMFGVITQCTLALQDNPDDYLELFFSLPEESDAIKLRNYLNAQIEGGVDSLFALEYFGLNARKYMNNEEVLFSGDDKVGVFVKIPLYDKELEDAAEEWLDMLVEADCNINPDAIVLFDSDREREIFQDARHSMPANSLEIVQHRGTFTIMTDALVPEDKFTEFMEFTNNIIESENMDYLSFGHLGDCHIHFMILPEKEQLDRAVELYDKIIAKSAELGGVYSGEHGTGKRKRADFLRCFGSDAVEQVRKTKLALDPDLLLNRGNLFE